jgi:putative hemolysin
MNAMANLVTGPLGLGSVEEIESENVTLGELRLMATQAGEQGALTEKSKSLVLNSLAIAERRAEQIMVPRPRIAYLDLQRSMDENRRVMNERLYARLPLCDGGMDRVVGVVPTKEFRSAYNEAGDVSVLSLIAQRSRRGPRRWLRKSSTSGPRSSRGCRHCPPARPRATPEVRRAV